MSPAAGSVRRNLARTAAALVSAGVFVLAPVSAQTQSSSQQALAFHPDRKFELGSAVDFADLSAAKTSCVTGTEHDEPGIIGTNASVSVVRSASELRSAVGIDAKVDASYLAFSGGGSYSYKTENLFREDSLVMVLRAVSEYGRKHLQDVRLTDAASGWLANPAEHAHFRTACGTRFVSGVRRGASVAVILSLYGLSREEKSVLSASLEASGGMGGFSASASGSTSDTVSRIFKNNQAHLQVVATGDQGLASLKELLPALFGKPDSLEGVVTALQNYVGGFDPKNAAPIGYFLTPIDVLDPRITQEDPNVELRNTRMARVVDRYRALGDELRVIDRILDPADPLHSLAVQDVSTLRTRRDEVELALDTLAEVHVACRTPTSPIGNCRIPSEPRFELTSLLPRPPRASFELVDGDAPLLPAEARNLLKLGTPVIGANCVGDQFAHGCVVPFNETAQGFLREFEQLRPGATDPAVVLRFDVDQAESVSLWVRTNPPIDKPRLMRPTEDHLLIYSLPVGTTIAPQRGANDGHVLRYTLVFLRDASAGATQRPQLAPLLWQTRLPVLASPSNTIYAKIVNRLGAEYYIDLFDIVSRSSGPGIYSSSYTFFDPQTRGQSTEQKRRDDVARKVKELGTITR